jgi:hypothetical protein
MRKKERSFLSLITSRNSPNAGFMHQLELFERMGRIIDISNPEYRRFLMGQMALEQQGREKELSRLASFFLIVSSAFPCRNGKHQ